MRTRVRTGDPDAFAELFDAYARSVYNHAFRLTADWSAAEEVMSATFMESWRRSASIEAEGGWLRPWLLGIATNVARSQYRGNRRYRNAAEAAAAAGAAEEQVEDHAEEETVTCPLTSWVTWSTTDSAVIMPSRRGGGCRGRPGWCARSGGPPRWGGCPVAVR